MEYCHASFLVSGVAPVFLFAHLRQMATKKSESTGVDARPDVELKCDNCKTTINASWKFCGKCGAFLEPKLKQLPAARTKLREQTDELRDSFDNTMRSIKESRTQYKRDKSHLRCALTVMEVNNGRQTELGYDELLQTERAAGRWRKPVVEKTEIDMSHFKDITFPIRSPRPRLEPLKHTFYNTNVATDEQENDDEESEAQENKSTQAWFWGEAKFSPKQTINTLWTHPEPEPPPPQPEPVEEPVDESIALRQQEEAEKAAMFQKLEAWPNIMGKRFRQCINSMKGNLRLCDIDVINYKQHGRIKFLNDLLEALLHDIHTTKNTAHVINQEQLLYFNELEEFRVKVTSSLTSALELTAQKSSPEAGAPDWVTILATDAEDKQREEVDCIMRLRYLNFPVVSLLIAMY